MATSTQGVIVEVSQINVGSQLAADAAIGATTITVDDTADFDEAGGTLAINGATMAYTALDTDGDVITLAAALTAAASAGDPVNLWDTTRNVVCTELVAQVAVSGADANSDPILAVVEHSLADRVPEGIRTGSGESVQLTLEAGTWYVTGVLGLAPVIIGTQFIGIGSGNEVLIYTDTPGTGNIYASISAMNGVDDEANTVHDGFVSYSPGASTSGFAQLAVNQTDNTPYLVLFANGVTLNHLSFPFQAWSATGNSGAANEQYVAQITGPVNSQQADGVTIYLFSSSSDKTLDAGGRLYYNDASGGSNVNLNWDFSGTSLYVAKLITAVVPGTGTSPTNPAKQESWRVVGATSQPAFGSGFGAGVGVPRFRLEPLGGGLVRLDGTVATTAATAAGATMFTLPVGYRPTAAKRFVGVSSASGFTSNNPGATSVQITTAGVVQCVQAASASGQQIVLDGIVFPVD